MIRSARAARPAGPARSREGGGAASARGGGPSLTRRLAGRLWDLLTSMRVALAVILALAVLGFVGTVLVQAPASALADPGAKADWLEGVRPRYGALTGFLDQLGLFAVFDSLLFRALVAFLAASLVACVVHRTRRFWRASVRPGARATPGFFGEAPRRETMTGGHSPEETLARVRAALARRRYRTLVEDDGTVHLYADRNRWGPLGSLAGHLGLLVILAGAVVGSAFGFSEAGFMVTEGFSEPVPRADDLSLELEAFRDTYDPTTGAPSDFASDVVLRRAGTEVARQTIRVNEPLRFEGRSFYQEDFGRAAVVTVRDAAGATIGRLGVPLAYRTAEGRRLGSAELPGADLTAVLVGTSGPGDAVVEPGQLLVMLYPADGLTSPVATATLDQGVATALGGLEVMFERESQYASLKVASDPGVPLVWLGCILLVAGFAASFLLPHRRLWGRLVTGPDGATTLSIAPVKAHDPGFEAEFTSLVTDIRAALDAPAQA